MKTLKNVNAYVTIDLLTVSKYTNCLKTVFILSLISADYA